ncbi:MAG: VOC family protein [Pseudomonadota bacterium]
MTDRPAHPVKGVDHVFLLINDLDRGASQFRALGFTVSPRGMHSAHKGSANHTIMFPHDYVELLGLVAETEENAPRRATLAEQGEGLHAVACRIDNAAAAETALAAHGIPTEGLGDFSRPVPLADGRSADAAFSTLQFAREAVPFGTCFMCQHKTRELVWQKELVTHGNGAVGLAGILAGVPDPQTAGHGYARLFADGRAVPIDGGCRVETGPGSAPLILLTPDALAAHYPSIDLAATPRGAFAGMQIRVSDTGRARSCLTANGLTCVDTEAGILVGPEATGGAILEFVGP